MIKRRIRIKKKKTAGVRPMGTSPVRARGGRASGWRGGRYKRLRLFIRTYYKRIAIAAAVIVAGIVCLIVFVGADRPVASDNVQDPTGTPDALPVVSDSPDPAAMDDDTLAGLTGSDDSLFSDDDELTDSLFKEEGPRIGITVGKLHSSEEERILNSLETAANEAQGQKQIGGVLFYNAEGNYNQQVQDVRSLIKNGVNVIVAGFSDKTSFNMVAMMAQKEGIPVVAIDAPVKTGYAVNVVADEAAWGQAYGVFMAQNLTGGSVAAVFDDKDDPADAARLNAALGELAKNPALTPLATLYAAGKKADAKAAMAALLKEGDVDGVITEGGMAEGILDAYIEAGRLPKVMCADVTAGFIKKWYALKNGGLSIKTSSSHNGDEPEATPTLILAQPGEMVVCAQPSTASMGAAAFEFALRLAQGRTLIAEGQTFTYQVNTRITEQNLGTYYEQIKDKDSSFTIQDTIDTSKIEALFEKAAEE